MLDESSLLRLPRNVIQRATFHFSTLRHAQVSATASEIRKELSNIRPTSRSKYRASGKHRFSCAASTRLAFLAQFRFRTNKLIFSMDDFDDKESDNHVFNTKESYKILLHAKHQHRSIELKSLDK